MMIIVVAIAQVDQLIKTTIMTTTTVVALEVMSVEVLVALLV
jgi:hypothetical protein